MSSFLGQSSTQERARVAARLALASGEALNGHVIGPVSGRLRDALNSAEPFVEFVRRDGAAVFIAKHAIAQVEANEVPRADQLSRRLEAGGFDPWTTLGVERGVGPGEIKTAYWAKARLYHPDKLAGKDAPREVIEYLNAMFARIHAAYRELAGEAAEAG